MDRCILIYISFYDLSNQIFPSIRKGEVSVVVAVVVVVGLHQEMSEGVWGAVPPEGRVSILGRPPSNAIQPHAGAEIQIDNS